MKRLLVISMMIVLTMLKMSNAVLVDGNCYLENQTNHEGIKVLFLGDSIGAIDDSTITDATGYYQTDLAPGFYDVYFYEDNYYDGSHLDQAAFGPLTLPDITLTILPIADGFVLLENQTNHQGIKVLFSAVSSGAQTDSVYSIQSGAYELYLNPGTYDITFSYTGYFDWMLDNYIISGAHTLDDIMLISQIGTIPISGNLSGTLAGNTNYLVQGDITVPADSSLIIESGAKFLFAGDYLFLINGYLHAAGTLLDSIYFQPCYNTDSWQGIRFWGTTIDTCRLDYCKLKEATNAAINVSASSPIINHCLIEDSHSFYGTITIWDGNTKLSGCTIKNNSSTYCGAVYTSSGADIIIENCIIEGNYGNSNTGGVSVYAGADVTMSNSIIRNNSASLGGGGIRCASAGATLIINNCLITGNTGGDVAGVYNTAFMTMENCTISNNDGIGLYTNSASTVKNSIISNNNGSGVQFISSADTSLIYCDVYNNAGGNFSGNMPTWIGQIVTVNANDDSCDIYQNILLDPQFYATAGDSAYFLTATSPCIDAGDPGCVSDPDSTVSDIGAYYYDQGSSIARPEMLLSADSLNFGTSPLTQQVFLPFTIYSVGDTNLVVNDITSSNPAFTTGIAISDSSVAPGDSLEILVIFTPDQATQYNEGLIIISNDPYSPIQIVTLSGEGIEPVQVTLTPLNPPITIPENGGSFEFNISVENNSNLTQQFDLWTEIDLPGTGSVEILTITEVSFPGNTTIERDRTQIVPGFAPAGTYTYYAYIGDYPWVVEHSDSFTFVKEGTLGDGALGTASDWFCSGESFDSFINVDDVETPSEYALHGCYPNPFNPTTTISFALPEAKTVNLAVFDISGRQVAELVNGWRDEGNHLITFDASHLPSGIYFAELTAGEFSAVQKMVLVK